MLYLRMAHSPMTNTLLGLTPNNTGAQYSAELTEANEEKASCPLTTY